jgi:hypothetical protein
LFEVRQHDCFISRASCQAHVMSFTLPVTGMPCAIVTIM